MVKYALDIVLSIALILLLGTCGDRGAGPETGRIALDVQDPEASGTAVQRVDRMVVTVLQNETVVMSEDLRYEGGVWLGELTISTGSYSVVVEAYKEAIVKWRGSALVLVQGGESNRVVIALTSTNQVPVLADIGDQAVAEGRTLTILLVGSDADGDALTYAVEGAPEGSSLSGSTFTWEPSHTQAGEYSVIFTVADEHGGVARETITITVGETNQAPELEAIGDQTVAEGSLLTIPLVGTDEDGNALTYAVEGAPAGSALSGSTFTWEPSPTQAGEYSVTFTVADEHGGVARETIIITVGETNQAPTLEAIGDQTVAEGSLLTIPLVGTDEDGDALTYSVVDNPAGSSLSEQTFRWTPSRTQAGEYSVTFTVADEHGGVARETITITVGETNQAPELEAIGDQTVAEGSLLTIPLVGTDEDGNALTYAVEGPPAGSALSGSTFTWEPSHTQAGEYSVTFTVTDEHGGVARETIIITVGETNQAPELADVGNQNAGVGKVLTIILEGSDADGDDLTYSIEGEPTGASLSEQTFSWKPSSAQVGDYEVTFIVEDGRGGSDRQSVTINVEANQIPELASIGHQTIGEGEVLMIILEGSDADGDDLTYSVAGEPIGASLSEQTFSWRPSSTQVGSYEITFTVGDGRGGSDSQSVSINVEANQIPELASIGPHTAEEGSALTIILEGSDADGDALTYGVERPPTGAVLSEQTFRWTPSFSQAGEYEITFTVEDGRGGIDRETVTITVGDINRAPELATIGDQTVNEASALTITLADSDADGDALTLAVEGQPEGSSLSGRTFRWTPSFSQAGEYEITFTVEDGRGGIDRETVTITVRNTNREPELATIGDQTVVEGHTLTITLAGSDPDGEDLIYMVEDNPPGSSLSGTTFTWQPSDTGEGMYQVTFRVEDEHGGQAVETIVIIVKSRLRRLTNHEAVDGGPSWSPDGTQIAFESRRDGIGNSKIYVMDAADGSNPRPLIFERSSDAFPSWSPDGTQIAFHDRYSNGEYRTLYVMDADGSNPRQLSRRSGGFPSWSPDGSEIVFESNRDFNREIYVMDADGSNSRRLTNHNAADGRPSWSPDGTQIAFESDRDGNREIYVMDADGSNSRRLTRHNASDGTPSWSPDGTQIAFHSDRDGNWNLYVIDADGSNPRQLTSHNAGDAFPSWSPDGSEIVFESDRDGNVEIYVLDLQGE